MSDKCKCGHEDYQHFVSNTTLAGVATHRGCFILGCKCKQFEPAEPAPSAPETLEDHYREVCVFCGKMKLEHFFMRPHEEYPICYEGNLFGRRFQGSGKFVPAAPATPQLPPLVPWFVQDGVLYQRTDNGILEHASSSLARKIAEDYEPRLSAALAEVATLREENAALRKRIHHIEEHNQYFFRCESAWCNPDEKNNPALEILKGSVERAVNAESEVSKLQAELAANQQKMDALQRAEHSYRKLMWLSHGHAGLYGDDGEMQCGLCTPTWDYKNAPLEDVEKAYAIARAAIAEERAK